MPAPRVKYEDLPKETRDRIDRDEAKLSGGYKKPIGPQQPSKKQQAAQRKIDQDIENVKDRQRAEEAGTTAKDFREMKKRNEEKKSAPAAPSRTEKAKNWIQERGRAIAQNTQDIRPRGKGPGVYGAMSMGMPANPDLFGVGGFGGMHKMMGADPFQEMFPRQAPAPPRPAPQRRKKKRKSTSRRAPAQQQGGMPGMGMGIPKGMKWMFGQ